MYTRHMDYHSEPVDGCICRHCKIHTDRQLAENWAKTRTFGSDTPRRQMDVWGAYFDDTDWYPSKYILNQQNLIKHLVQLGYLTYHRTSYGRFVKGIHL